MSTIEKNLLEKLKLPLVIIGVVTALIVVWKLFDLPPEEVLITQIERYFERYGLLTVFIASLIEGMLFIGWYLPGSLVIFLGVITAHDDPVRAFYSVIVTWIGITIAYAINYCLGKYGWYKLFAFLGFSDALESAKHTYEKHHIKSLYLSYWQPNLGGLVASSAGILKAPFFAFFLHSLTALLLWLSFWGLTTFIFGEIILRYLAPIFFVVLVSWVGIIVYKS